ncbi:MAG: cupin domain-containing protein [Gemmatimonadales bacterium]
MADHFFSLSGCATYRADRFVKLDLVAGRTLFLGLNCFEDGQSQAVHTHGGADKFYLILSGNARMIVGEHTVDAGPNTLVWAPVGVPHGVERAYGRTLMLVGMAPPPG